MQKTKRKYEDVIRGSNFGKYLLNLGLEGQREWSRIIKSCKLGERSAAELNLRFLNIGHCLGGSEVSECRQEAMNDWDLHP